MKRYDLRFVGMIAALLLVTLFSPGCEKEPDEPIYQAFGDLPETTEVQYELSAVIDSRLELLQGVAVDGTGRIFAVGYGGLNVFDGEGKFLANWLKGEKLRCVASAEDGTVYVAAGSRVIKLDGEGRQLDSWESFGSSVPRLGMVTSLSVRGIDLLVADADARRVHRVTVDGYFSNGVPAGATSDNPSGKLTMPSAHLDAVLTRDGKVMINHPGKLRVETYTLDGELVSFWGKPGLAADGFCGCCNPTDIALSPDGSIVTAEKGIYRVKLYSPEGEMLGFIGPENFSSRLEFMDAALDVAVDSVGRIIVADPGDGKIRIFSPRGK